MFSKELEDLIQATLEDGVLEDYEKAALVKRATAEGVDLTELEIYINSILQKHKKEHDQAEDAKQEKIDQKKKEAFGRVCPNCGRQVPPMTLKCICGYEFSKRDVVSSVKTLADDIEKILTENTKLGIIKRTKLITDKIRMFPVPNSKEDIIEFLSMAAANSEIRGGLWGSTSGRMLLILIFIIIVCTITGLLIANGTSWSICVASIWVLLFGCTLIYIVDYGIIASNQIATAWRKKLKQIMLKARSLRGDPEFTQQLNYYESLLEK